MTSPELLDESSPAAELVVSAWLAPWKRGTRRLSGDPVPYRLIHTVAGSDDPDTGLTEAVVSIHTFAADPVSAVQEADNTHRRMMLLAHNPLADIALSSGQVVCVDYVKTAMLPTRVDYDDPGVIRYVARYDIGLAYTPTGS